MKRQFESPQPRLFEEGEPSVVLTRAQEVELTILVETLLREIAMALANGGSQMSCGALRWNGTSCLRTSTKATFRGAS